MSPPRTAWFAVLALLGFATNSILCRVALRSGSIDAATFTTVRVIAGAAVLLFVTRVMGARDETPAKAGSWTSAAVLVLYAVPFSFAYNELTAATGALILFGCVQLTMMVAALLAGERPHALQWVGLGLAFGGLVYLMLPGLAAPPLLGAAVMGLSGFAWAIYSLRGRGSANPLAETTSNFVRSVPLVLAVSVVALPQFHAEAKGIGFAAASGAVGSGLGYVLWYKALRGLTATRASVIQLPVPVLTALAGVVFLSEVISMRLVVSAVMVLGGITAALRGRERFAKAAS